MRVQCTGQTAGRRCVCVREAERDATLERYCYNVNSRAAGSASFATDPFCRGKKKCFISLGHSCSLNHYVFDVYVNLSAQTYSTFKLF